MDNKFELPREGVRIYDPKSGWQDSVNKTSDPAREASQVKPSEHQAFQGQDEPSDDDERDHYEDETLHENEPLAENELDEHEIKEAQNRQHQSQAEDSFQVEDRDELLDPREDDRQQSSLQSPFQAQPQGQSHSPEAFAAEALRSLSDNLSSAGSLAGYSGPSRGTPAAGLVPQGQAAALAKVGDSLDGLFTVIQRSTLANSVDGSAPSWRDVANISRHLEGRLNTRQELLKELTKVDREIRDTRDDLLLTLKALSEFEQQNLQAASMRASISSMAARVIAKRFEEPGDN